MLTPLPPSRSIASAGFTMVELIVALLILAVALLGMNASTGRLIRSVAEEEVRASVHQAVDDRLSEIRMDPRYALLDSLYSGTEVDVLGMPGFTRTTQVSRVQETGAPGRVRDLTTVTVTVIGPFLGSPSTRQMTVAAP